MRPEYRNEIDPKYRKKIEAMVRWVMSMSAPLVLFVTFMRLCFALCWRLSWPPSLFCHLMSHTPPDLCFTTYLSASQASWYIRAGGGNYPVSLLWLPATTERTAVHLLQEQPALLHRHGTHSPAMTCWFTKSSYEIQIPCIYICIICPLSFLGSPYVEGGLVCVSTLWISCPLLTVHPVSGKLAC